MHVSASIFINEDGSGLHRDYDRWLETFAPHEPGSQYPHNDTGKDNADAHIKRQIMGREVVVAVTESGWISGRGSRSSTGSSMGADASGCW